MIDIDEYCAAREVLLCDNCEQVILPGEKFRWIVGWYDDNGLLFYLHLCGTCTPIPVLMEGEDLIPSVYEVSKKVFDAIRAECCDD